MFKKHILKKEELTFQILYSRASQRPKFDFELRDDNLKGDLVIQFSDSLFTKLGGDPTYNCVIYAKSHNSFPYAINLNSESNEMFIYTDK